MKACIIGAGVIGCAVALELQRRGFQVTVVDKNGDAGHGSTSASCGIVRRFYAQPGMIAMAHEGAQIWADWRLSGSDRRREDRLSPSRRALHPAAPGRRRTRHRGRDEEARRRGQHPLSHEIAERFPFLDVTSFYPPTAPDDPLFFETGGRPIEGGVFEADGGYVVYPALAAQNLRRAGEREGVRFLFHHQVATIRKTSAHGFLIEFAGNDALETEIVVNVSGPHSAITNRLAGVTLPLETRALRREVHALENPLQGAATSCSPWSGIWTAASTSARKPAAAT